MMKHVVPTLVALVLAIGFGPLDLPLPGLPQHRIVDAGDLFSQSSVAKEGSFAPNNILREATVLFNGTLSAETVIPNADGTELILGDKYGAIYTAVLDPSAPGGYALAKQPRAHLSQGRPMGGALDRDGNILIANCGQGLVKLVRGAGPGGADRVELLATRVSDDSPLDPGSPIVFANDVAVHSSGVVYFTDSQSIPPQPTYPSHGRPYFDILRAFFLNIYSGKPTGRLLAYFPNNGSVHVLVRGFWYSNGIALSADESFLAVSETNRFRVLQFWLNGDKAGSLTVLIDRLPGFPDGIKPAAGGGFWVAMPTTRTKLFDMLENKLVRTIAAWAPIAPPTEHWGAAFLVSETGQVLHYLNDPDGSHVAFVTSVSEAAAPGASGGKRRLFLGNIAQNYVSYVDVGASARRTV